MFGKEAKPVIKQFEEAIEQETMAVKKLKDYVYGADTDETPLKTLYMNMRNAETKKRQIHQQLRKMRRDIH